MNAFTGLSVLISYLLVIQTCPLSKPTDIQDYERPEMTATFTDTEIKVDGKLDETAWDLRSWSEQWVDLASCEPADYQTEHKITWDEENLYVGARLMDPNISASVTEQNQRLFQYDNTFELFLDPGADGKSYYEFQVNANGATWQLSLDKKYKDGGTPTDPDMIYGIQVAVHTEGTLNRDSDTDEYWSVEVAIPWSSMKRFDVAEDVTTQVWKVNLSRVFQTGDEAMPQKYWVWSCTEVMDMHQPDRWGTLRFAR